MKVPTALIFIACSVLFPKSAFGLNAHMIEGIGTIEPQCGSEEARDFSMVPLAKRAAVKRFYHNVVARFDEEQRQAQAELDAALWAIHRETSPPVIGAAAAEAYSRQQRQRSDMLLANARATSRRRMIDLYQRTQAFMAGLSPQEREAANRALAVITCPVPSHR